MHDLKILTVGRNVKFFSFYVTGCGNMWYRLLRRTLVQLVLYAADEKLDFATLQMFIVISVADRYSCSWTEAGQRNYC